MSVASVGMPKPEFITANAAHARSFAALQRVDPGFTDKGVLTAQIQLPSTRYKEGSQMSAFLLGVPDNGILGLRDVVDHARHMARVTPMPILVDADTGFGNAVNVHYTVQEMINAGVAGLQIEDQEAPKKSSTSAGRRCISLDEAVGKYRAAVAAKNEIDPEFVICARCDTLGAENGGFEETIKRFFPQHDTIIDRAPLFAKKYAEARRAANVLDYDDLLEFWLELLRKSPETAEYFAHRFRHILRRRHYIFLLTRRHRGFLCFEGILRRARFRGCLGRC